MIQIGECSRGYSRGDAVVGPEASENPDVWKINFRQELGRFLLGQEDTSGGVLSVDTILRWNEEFNASSLRSPRHGLLLWEGNGVDGAEHDINAPEGFDNSAFALIISFRELSTIVEPLWVVRLNDVL